VGDAVSFGLSCDNSTFNSKTWRINGVITSFPVTFNASGTYTVSVDAECSEDPKVNCHPHGNSEYVSKTITVSPRPVPPVISASSLSVCDGHMVTLSIANPQDFRTYTWKVGNSTIGTGTTITPVV